MIGSIYDFLPLKKSLFTSKNLDVPPASQEGDERKIYWIIQTNTAYENCNWLAKAWSIQVTSFFFFILKKFLFTS